MSLYDSDKQPDELGVLKFFDWPIVFGGILMIIVTISIVVYISTGGPAIDGVPGFLSRIIFLACIFSLLIFKKIWILTLLVLFSVVDILIAAFFQLFQFYPHNSMMHETTPYALLFGRYFGTYLSVLSIDMFGKGGDLVFLLVLLPSSVALLIFYFLCWQQIKK